MANKMKIAIIGVGSVGAGLGERLATVGHEVVFGVRLVEGGRRPGSR